jgi:hypothetical protein
MIPARNRSSGEKPLDEVLEADNAERRWPSAFKPVRGRHKQSLAGV